MPTQSMKWFSIKKNPGEFYFFFGVKTESIAANNRNKKCDLFGYTYYIAIYTTTWAF